MIRYNFETYQDMIARLYPDTYLKGNIQTLSCTFQVTDICNLACTYCYQIKKSNHIMSFEIAKKFIDLLLDNNELTKQYIDTRNSKAIILDFIGGEPLLEIELIDQICDYFYTQAIIKDHPWQYYWTINISTNGTLYFEPNVQKFIKKWKNYLNLAISIDGNKELHDSCRIFADGSGSYDIVSLAVQDYMKHNEYKELGNKMTLAPENVQYTAQALISLIEIGYKNINVNCAYEKGWTYNHAKILYQQLKIISEYLLKNNLEEKIRISMFNAYYFHPLNINDTTNWCGGNGNMIAIDWKGDIYPCLRYMESSLGDNIPPIIIGDVNNGIMYNKKYKETVKLLRSINRITQSTEECINCQIASGCAWCQAYNYQDSNGNINHRATYICCMHKAIALANCYFWNLYYWKHKKEIRFKLWLSYEESLKIISDDEYWMLKTLSYPCL